MIFDEANLNRAAVLCGAVAVSESWGIQSATVIEVHVGSIKSRSSPQPGTNVLCYCRP